MRYKNYNPLWSSFRILVGYYVYRCFCLIPGLMDIYLIIVMVICLRIISFFEQNLMHFSWFFTLTNLKYVIHWGHVLGFINLVWDKEVFQWISLSLFITIHSRNVLLPVGESTTRITFHSSINSTCGMCHLIPFDKVWIWSSFRAIHTGCQQICKCTYLGSYIFAYFACMSLIENLYYTRAGWIYGSSQWKGNAHIRHCSCFTSWHIGSPPARWFQSRSGIVIEKMPTVYGYIQWYANKGDNYKFHVIECILNFCWCTL